MVVPNLWARHSVTFLSRPAPSDVLPAPTMLLGGGRVGGDKEFAQLVTSVSAQAWERA